MILSEIGKIAEKYWQEIPEHFDFVILDCFVIMPNHIHGILEIRKTNINETRQCLVSTHNKSDSFHYRYRNPGKGTISAIIGSYKSAVTKDAHQINPDFKWLPRFYDHIIKNQEELENIQNYIVENPLNWENNKISKRQGTALSPKIMI